jgi:hypothetical protein
MLRQLCNVIVSSKRANCRMADAARLLTEKNPADEGGASAFCREAGAHPRWVRLTADDRSVPYRTLAVRC